MNASFIQFAFRCAVIIAAGAVLALTLIEVGTASESAGVCANISRHFAAVNWLQSAVRPLAVIARFCA
mgnify:CR=1 FL=1